MSIPSPRAHDGENRDVAEAPRVELPAGRTRYPVTSAYLAVMVTLILLAVVFEWRL